MLDRLSDVERWVWQRIREGQTADLNERDREKDPSFEDLDPTEAKNWGDSRRLHVSFLQTILTEKSFVDATPFQGVKILGALVDGDDPLDLAHTRLDRLLWIERSRLLVDVECRDIRIDGEFSLEGSYIDGNVSLYMAKIGSGLSLANSLCKRDISLVGAKVGGQLYMYDSTFDGDVTMEILEVEGGLFITNNSTFKGPLNLNGAKVGGQLVMSGSAFEGAVTMESLEVANALVMSEEAIFRRDVVLNSAKIGGQLMITGSTFDGAVSMDKLNVASSLFMKSGVTFKGDLNMNGAKVGGQLAMSGATFEGAVTMDKLHVASSLLMREEAAFKGHVNLRCAKVNGQIEMSSSTFKGAVTMDSLEVAGSLLMNKDAIFEGHVNLVGAQVGGQLEMSGSAFEGAVTMDSLEVVGSLFMKNKATFKSVVNLNGAKVGRQLEMSGSTFEGTVTMYSVEVAIGLFMTNKANFVAPIDMLYGHIGGSLDLSGAVLTALDLTGTQIDGELRLGSGGDPPTEWGDDGRLVLRNTHAGALQDRIVGQCDAWPKDRNLQLGGFTYDRLGGFKGGGEADMLDRATSWYENWLARDPAYSPQPYEQLAKVFRAAGHPAKATDILYAGRERERKEARGAKRWGLHMLKWFIGYGLGVRYFRSLGWVCLVAALGTGLLGLASHLSTAIPNQGLAWNLACSLDLLLPIVELNKAHDTFVMTTIGEKPVTEWIKYYFYAHKLFGWVLASFLIAGLAGLTQRS